MTVADDYLVGVGAVLDELDRERVAWPSRSDQRLPDCAREVRLLSEALQPVTGIAIKLGAGQAPGTDAVEDASWAASVALARREVLRQPAVGVDGLREDSLRLLDCIDALIATWPDGDWDDLACRRVQERVDACLRGARRGQEMRHKRLDLEHEDDVNLGWLLGHPNDHWLRHAASAVSDPELRALIAAQIDRLAPSYERLCGLDWTSHEAAADLICEMRVLGRCGDWIGWTEPVSAVVTTPAKGNVSLAQQILVRLVEDPDAMFNGTLMSLLGGERWLVCGRELGDGTLLPLDGTRRLATPGL
jgi:hypothetical protein